PTDSPNYQDTLNKVLLWRAVADYQQPEHPIGPPPDASESKAIRAYYQQAQHALQAAATGPQNTQDRHNELLRSHAQLIDQLDDDPLDHATVDNVFDTDPHLKAVSLLDQSPHHPDSTGPDFDYLIHNPLSLVLKVSGQPVCPGWPLTSYLLVTPDRARGQYGQYAQTRHVVSSTAQLGLAVVVQLVTAMVHLLFQRSAQHVHGVAAGHR